MKYLIPCLILFCVSATLVSQNLDAESLLKKTIAYHDPQGVWESFKGDLSITLKYPDGKERNSTITLDNSKSFFKIITESDSASTTSQIKQGDCSFLLNNKTPNEEELEKHKLSCDRTYKMRDYYTYLYGLPMKLKDSGTIMSPKVLTKKFKGEVYDVIKVTYEVAVGKDTWYFYFDKLTHALEIYQFFHDESKNDGEYILLSGLEEINGVKIPKTRAWYYNKDDGYLGTDILN